MYTDALYSRPSFFSGIARLFDFWGLFDAYNSSKDERTADLRALASDWQAVGADIEHAMDLFADQEIAHLQRPAENGRED